jgi:hypothetical protein
MLMLLYVSFLTGKRTTVHKNARLTPKGRALMLARLKVCDVAQATGISLTTLNK